MRGSTSLPAVTHVKNTNQMPLHMLLLFGRMLKTLVCFYRSMTSLNALEAILWDMDGVLADTERDAHRPAFNVAFKENNLDTEWDVERYGKLLEVGGGKERMTAHWNEVGWPENFPEDRQAKVKELHLRKTDIFMDMIKSATVPHNVKMIHSSLFPNEFVLMQLVCHALPLSTFFCFHCCCQQKPLLLMLLDLLNVLN